MRWTSMPSSADATAGEADPHAARRERRLKRRCLIALTLLLPLTFAFESRNAIADLFADRELLARDVPVGTAASYVQDEWKLDTFKIITGGDPRLVMPEDRAFVLVRLAVDIRKDVGEDWTGCRLSLVDGEGRRFLPLFLTLPGDIEKLIEPDGRSAPSCGSVSLAKPKAGSQVLVEEIYVVPRAALSSVRPVFSAMGGRPRYLRFDVP
jgi:hypothetical protein